MRVKPDIVVFILGSIFISISLTNAAIINIPDDFPIIQQGINASSAGDTVLVHPGLYIENLRFNIHDITLASLYLTTEDTSYLSSTIIDGDSSGTVIILESEGGDNTAIVGLTIQNGYTSDNGGGIYCNWSQADIHHNIISSNICQLYGGGIYCSNANIEIHDNVFRYNLAGDGGAIGLDNQSHAHIYNNIISHNSAMMWQGYSRAGAIFCFDRSNPLIHDNTIEYNFGRVTAAISVTFYCQPVITDNILRYNEAIYCGVIGCSDSDPFIAFNTIAFNTVDSSGGAFFIAGSNPEIVNNVVYENSSGTQGGAIYSALSSPVFRNNIIINNRAAWNGGAVFISESSPVFINNVFSGNEAEGLGGAIYATDGSFLSGINCILWQNTDIDGSEIFLQNGYCDLAYSCIVGGWPGEGNLDCDPLFRDPGNSDYHLMAAYCGDATDSPCIDRGSPNCLDSLLDCDWGLGEAHSDMGAYGGGDTSIVSLDGRDDQPWAWDITIYPNPFNAAAAINFSLSVADNIRGDIYDILGRQVATVIDDYLYPGYHSVIWRPANLGSGQYYLKIHSDHLTVSRKMLYIK